LYIVKKLEPKVAKLFRRSPRLPSGFKDIVSELWPWLAAAFGILQAFNAWELWDLTQAVTRMQGYNIYYAANPYSLSSADKWFACVGIVLLATQAVVLFTAFSELRNRSVRGWELSFVVGILNVGYAIDAIFVRDQGFSTFLYNLVVSVIGFYLLFQIQSRYKKASGRARKKIIK